MGEHLYRLEHASALQDGKDKAQLGLFAEAERRRQESELMRLRTLASALQEVNIDQIRPMDALVFLDKLKKDLEG